MASPFDPVPPSADDKNEPPLRRKLFWFIALALAGAALVAAAAYMLRALLFLEV